MRDGFYQMRDRDLQNICVVLLSQTNSPRCICLEWPLGRYSTWLSNQLCLLGSYGRVYCNPSDFFLFLFLWDHREKKSIKFWYINFDLGSVTKEIVLLLFPNLGLFLNYYYITEINFSAPFHCFPNRDSSNLYKTFTLSGQIIRTAWHL